MSTPLELLWPLLGAALVAVAQLDILVTVLHPHRESPLSARFQRLTWRLLRLVDRLTPRTHAILTWALPLLIAGLILLWLALPLVGYALIYYPWVDAPTAFQRPAAGDWGFVDALYFSGAALTTAGFGDLHPLAWPFKLLAIAEAASGLVVVSLSVAYLLAVYPALARKRATAVALDAEVAGRASALPMLRRYLVERDNGDGSEGGAAGAAELAGRLRELSGELLGLTESHATHPVLYYARPPEVRQSFLRVLVVVQHLVGALRYGLSPDRHGALVRNPQLLLLEQSLLYSLRQLSSSLHIAAVPHAADEAARRRLADEFHRLCADLERLGLVSALSEARAPVPAVAAQGAAGRGGGRAPVLDPALDLAARSPVQAYVAYRLETDPHIAAYAAASGYPLEAATSDYETTWERGAAGS